MHELALANYAETFMSSDSFEMQKKINAVEPAGIGLPRKIRHAGISLV